MQELEKSVVAHAATKTQHSQEINEIFKKTKNPQLTECYRKTQGQACCCLCGGGGAVGEGGGGEEVGGVGEAAQAGWT